MFSVMLSLPLNRLLPCRLAGLVFLLILSGCGVSSSGIEATAHPVPPTATHSSTGASIRHFIDTRDNIHLFLSFDYKIPDPAAIARHYDFAWGSEVYHVTALRSGNPNIFLTYYIPF